MTWTVSLRRWRRQSIGDRYPRHYFLYDRGLLGNLLLILLGLQGPWTPAFSSSVSKQHAPEDLLAICLPNVCHVFGVQPQLVFHMLVLLCRTFVAWSGFCIPNYFLGQQNNESVFPRKKTKQNDKLLVGICQNKLEVARARQSRAEQSQAARASQPVGSKCNRRG